MSDRFSPDTLGKIYDTGYRGLSREKSYKNKILSLITQLDLISLAAQPEAQEKIRSLAPQTLYLALKAKGPADCLEVLPLLSQEQFVRLCDYDVWHEDSLSTKSLLYWLELYGEISPRQMYQRFRQLEEEYQLAALGPFVKVYTQEDYERMSDEQQDRLYRFPNDALYYSINSEEEELHRGLSKLIELCMGEDMAYAMALVANAAYAPPHEQEQLQLQFRNARLEEDGFVSYQESLSCFSPLKPPQTLFSHRPSAVRQPEASSLTPRRAESFSLEDVLAHGQRHLWSHEESARLQQGFLALANSLCAACQVESDDTQGLAYCLEHAAGLIALALEGESGGDLEQAAKILLQAYPKKLFRYALGWTHELRLASLSQLQELYPQETKTLDKYYRQLRFGACLNWLDKAFLPLAGYERTEILKGLFNRFPAYPQTTADGQKLTFAPLACLGDLQTLTSSTQEVIESLRSVGSTLFNLSEDEPLASSQKIKRPATSSPSSQNSQESPL